MRWISNGSCVHRPEEPSLRSQLWIRSSSLWGHLLSLSNFGVDSNDNSWVWRTGRVHVIKEIPYSPKWYFFLFTNFIAYSQMKKLGLRETPNYIVLKYRSQTMNPNMQRDHQHDDRVCRCCTLHCDDSIESWRIKPFWKVSQEIQ